VTEPLRLVLTPDGKLHRRDQPVGPAPAPRPAVADVPMPIEYVVEDNRARIEAIKHERPVAAAPRAKPVEASGRYDAFGRPAAARRRRFRREYDAFGRPV
jgi:hypothetical protein